MPLDNFAEERSVRAGDYLPDTELSRLVAAVGNHELKALVSIAMQPGVLYDRQGLDSLATSIQGADPAWESTEGLPFDYCMHSLAPIGFVTKEYIDEDRQTIGFAKTTYGEEVGDAVSGHLLAYSLRHPDVSMIELFGRTSTTSDSGIRSPAVTIEVIKKLLGSELPIRVSDLLPINELGTSAASTHAQSLAHAGLITMLKRSHTDPILDYALAETPLAELPLRPHQSKLPSAVRDSLASLLLTGSKASVTIGEITADVVSHNPDFREVDPEKLDHQIRQALRFFMRRGAVKNVSAFTNEARSMITLSDSQRNALNDCLTLVEGLRLLDPRFIAEGRQNAREILADPDAVKALVIKARERSPFVRMRGKDERIQLFTGLLRQHPGASVVEVEEYVAQTGRRLSAHSVRRILRELEDEKLATSKKIDKRVLWFLLDQLEAE